MEIDKINKPLLVKTLNFHGVQLQKIFEAEYTNFSNLKLDSSLHFNEYAKRQKQLSFQDRGKRFRLQRFICKHANQLFNKYVKPIREDPTRNRIQDSAYFPILPPYETFLSVDKEQRLQRFFEYIKQGDIVAATVSSKTAAGMILKILYGECDEIRCVPDVGIKAFCPTSSLIAAVDKKTSTSRAFLINDLVCCEILEVSTDTEKIVCGMRGVHCRPENQSRLGLMHSDDFPIEYRIYQEKKKDISYSALLEKSESFHNPNLVNNLMTQLGISNELYTHYDYLKEKFPAKECALELRLAQAAKWAIHSVADGIEHFKCGRYSEAYQCLNKALTIDPMSVEALVARGALYANSSNYEKAIADFESALKFNPNHQNAKKYLGDTLIAYGRTFEENGKFNDAVKAYENCLNLLPNHEEASNSLQFIKTKMQTMNKIEDEVVHPEAEKIKNTLSQLLSQNEDKRLLLKEVKKLKKRQSSTSSSSSSSVDSSTDSSDDSSSSSSSSEPSKKKKSKKKDASLSPLSKRIASMENSKIDEAPNQVDDEGEYELRVRKFLEETKKDDDYEDKVRKFLDETAKCFKNYRKKKQKLKEEKMKRRKKEKKMKSKKRKRESKKKRRKDEKKHKGKYADDNDDLILPEKYLGLSSLKDLEELQSKLSAYYSKVEKNALKNKKIKLPEKKNNSSKHRGSSEEDNDEEEIKSPPPFAEKQNLDYEDDPTPEIKTELNAAKFKMQLTSATPRVKRRSTEDNLWGEENIIPEEEVKPKLDVNRIEEPLPPPPPPPLPPPPPPQKVERVVVEPILLPTNSPPRMDKLGGFHIKKMPSSSPKRDTYVRDKPARSKSNSRSRTPTSLKKRYSRSTSRRRYSRSRSRSNSYQRGKYSRHSRSRSYSRSRSRSPYYRRNQSRSRGTYYKPRSQGYRGYRGNRRSGYNGRNRGYNPRYRGRRPYKYYKSNREDRDYRRYEHGRSPSDDEYSSHWRDSSKERSRRHSSDRDGSYDRYVEQEAGNEQSLERERKNSQIVD